MNQIFNFKAWDIKNSIMYDSIYELYFENDALKEVIFSKTFIGGEEEVVWQFAKHVKLRPYVYTNGINDDEIYRDDIVKFTAFGRIVTGVVEWDDNDGLPGYCIVDIDGSETIWSFDYDDLEIIGDRYENPELLKI